MNQGEDDDGERHEGSVNIYQLLLCIPQAYLGTYPGAIISNTMIPIPWTHIISPQQRLRLLERFSHNPSHISCLMLMFV